MTTDPHTPFPRLRRAVRWLRDGWLVVGLSLALLAGIEGVYRAQRALRDAVGEATTPRAVSPPHPNAGESWWKGWYAQAIFRQNQYDPYRGWWKRRYAGAYFQVDSAGHRVTIQPPAAASPRRVFFLGGSTMWGYTTRDSFTIPSLVAGRLARLGISDVQITNLAQPAYNVTQGLISTMIEVRNGNTPAVAVFLDGHNDVAVAALSGRAGAVINEARYAQLFERRDLGFWATVAGFGGDLQFVQRLSRAVNPRGAPRGASRAPQAPCDDVARDYRNVVRAAEGLGTAFGFTAVFFWQPMLATTHKRRSAWERSIPPPRYRESLVRCTAAVDSALAERGGRTFYSLTGVFDSETSSVFLDHAGHVTERANGVIADRIVEVLAPLLRARH